MCGIAGLFYFDANRTAAAETLVAMIDRIAHRGPNGSGVYIDRNVGLGHRRLSVIDLEGGAQPMTDERGHRTIAYNGEFFNFLTVRDELRARGVEFRTRSDTEVLLKLGDLAFPDWISHVNGMFAFALWDQVKEELLLVRDRFGVKPLYYVADDSGVAFASEAKALQVSGIGGPFELDPVAIPEYLSFRYVAAPRTIFRGVLQIPPGHFMRLRRGSKTIQVQRYWREDDPDQAGDLPAGDATEFGRVFSRAVRRRLISDVPLGSFNSGGVDSSLVTREVRAQLDGRLHTFSVGFSESGYDESMYAAEVAERLGTMHHSESLSPQEYLDLLPKAIWHNDEPLCHPHSVHLFHLCRVASRYVTVVLTGEGADEVFFGYPRLHVARFAKTFGPARRILAKLVSVANLAVDSRKLAKAGDVFSSSIPPEIDSHRFVTLSTLQDLVGNVDYRGNRMAVLRAVSSNQTAIEGLLEYERYSYMQSLLCRLDKMSMANGLEARTPFLDFELVLWSKKVRKRDKVGLGLSNKLVLKRLAAQTFSSGLVYRNKIGFGVPLADWFRKEANYKDALLDLSSSNSFVSSLVPRSVVRRLVDSHLGGHRDESEALWGLLNLELWGRHVLELEPLRKQPEVDAGMVIYGS